MRSENTIVSLGVTTFTANLETLKEQQSSSDSFQRYANTSIEFQCPFRFTHKHHGILIHHPSLTLFHQACRFCL